jgi:hypothetical protein
MEDGLGGTKKNSLKFVALGGIWLDEICAPSKETLFDVPGGSVAFGKVPFALFERYISELTLDRRSYIWRSFMLARCT